MARYFVPAPPITAFQILTGEEPDNLGYVVEADNGPSAMAVIIAYRAGEQWAQEHKISVVDPFKRLFSDKPERRAGLQPLPVPILAAKPSPEATRAALKKWWEEEDLEARNPPEFLSRSLAEMGIALETAYAIDAKPAADLLAVLKNIRAQLDTSAQVVDDCISPTLRNRWWNAYREAASAIATIEGSNTPPKPAGVEHGGYVVTYKNGDAIWGYGATCDDAWADFVAGMKASGVEVVGEMDDSEIELDDPDSQTKANDYKIQSASAALVKRVEERGGAIAWGSRNGVLCTPEEEYGEEA